MGSIKSTRGEHSVFPKEDRREAVARNLEIRKRAVESGMERRIDGSTSGHEPMEILKEMGVDKIAEPRDTSRRVEVLEGVFGKVMKRRKGEECPATGDVEGYKPSHRAFKDEASAYSEALKKKLIKEAADAGELDIPHGERKSVSSATFGGRRKAA